MKKNNSKSTPRISDTLKELENAFVDWEQITKTEASPSSLGAAKAPPQDKEFAKKTKLLLEKLKTQILELDQ